MSYEDRIKEVRKQSVAMARMECAAIAREADAEVERLRRAMEPLLRDVESGCASSFPRPGESVDAATEREDPALYQLILNARAALTRPTTPEPAARADDGEPLVCRHGELWGGCHVPGCNEQSKEDR